MERGEQSTFYVYWFSRMHITLAVFIAGVSRWIYSVWIFCALTHMYKVKRKFVLLSTLGLHSEPCDGLVDLGLRSRICKQWGNITWGDEWKQTGKSLLESERNVNFHLCSPKLETNFSNIQGIHSVVKVICDMLGSNHISI